MSQLDAKTKEAAAASKEALNQKALAQQITKKLDVLSKKVKTLEQENTRLVEARLPGQEVEVQTEPDAVLLQAEAATAAAHERHAAAEKEWEAKASGLQAQAAREAEEHRAALAAADEARRAVEAELAAAAERAAGAAAEGAAKLFAEGARAEEQARARHRPQPTVAAHQQPPAARTHTHATLAPPHAGLR